MKQDDSPPYPPETLQLPATPSIGRPNFPPPLTAQTAPPPPPPPPYNFNYNPPLISLRRPNYPPPLTAQFAQPTPPPNVRYNLRYPEPFFYSQIPPQPFFYPQIPPQPFFYPQIPPQPFFYSQILPQPFFYPQIPPQPNFFNPNVFTPATQITWISPTRNCNPRVSPISVQDLFPPLPAHVAVQQIPDRRSKQPPFPILNSPEFSRPLPVFDRAHLTESDSSSSEEQDQLERAPDKHETPKRKAGGCSIIRTSDLYGNMLCLQCKKKSEKLKMFSASGLKSHYKVHQNPPLLFKCKECPNMFENDAELQDHM